MPSLLKAGMRVAIYARVSSEEQREGQTIDSQIAELERFAGDQQLNLSGIYKDEGWSGGVMARPDLDRLRDDAQKGCFEAVLINDVDRLARDVTHLGVVKRDLERNGVQVIFRKLPAETSPTYNLMVNILGSFAEFEREMIADRTRRGRKHKVEVRKQYLGCNTAYGYRYTPMNRTSSKEGVLEVASTEADVVRQMFEWVDREGLSARKVLNRLNERGIPPRKNGSKWAKSSVLRVLRNEMYAGVWYYNKHEGYEPKQAMHAPKYRKHVKSKYRRRKREEWIPVELPSSLIIVARDRWERVQLQLTKNIAFSPRNQKHNYLLSGLVYCGGCGARYVGNPDHGRYSYRCIARCKKCPAISESALNEAVWREIRRAILNPRLIVNHVERLKKDRKADVSAMQEDLGRIEQNLRDVDNQENRIFEAYRLSAISAEQLGRELRALSQRKAALSEQHHFLNSTTQSASNDQLEKSVEDYCEGAGRSLSSFTPEQRQQFLRTLIRRITFTGTEARIRGEIPFRPGDERQAEPANGLSPVTSSSREIENTMMHYRGRNAGDIETMEMNYRGRNHAPTTAFGLTAKIPPMLLIRWVDKRGRFCKASNSHRSKTTRIVVHRARAA
jgi:site-specific DNA recombinase